jgi:serine/threonine protein kinase/Tfp pilus assembly protein PilF
MTASTSMPAQIGRYEIRAVLGQGGMGTVFHAYDPRFERDVALKVLAFHLLGHEGLRARFEREAKTIASLEHPAIVPVYDFDEHEGQPFLVMRLMPGGTLTDRLAAGPLPTAEVARILKRIGSALDEAHAQGIVHRDLKPGNILFDKYNNAYLSDFGIVRLAEGTGVDLTGTGMVGTPGYMSPEQIQGKTIDGRTDIYALGVLVFEMLTASKPFTADTPAMIMMKQITEPIPDIHNLRPDLPADVDALIARSLSLQREERPASAGELVQLLQAMAVAATQAAENLAAEKQEDQSAADIPPPVPPTTIEPETPPPPSPEDVPEEAEMVGDLAATVVATPPPESLPPSPAPATALPAGASSRPGWLPALIVVIGLMFIAGAIGTVILVFSQFSADEPAVAESSTAEPSTSEPAGETDLETDDSSGLPDDEQPLDIGRAIDEAYKFLEDGDYEDALALTAAVLEADPENLPALEIRHFSLRDLGRFDEAIAAAERMVALEPENSGFIGELAVTQDWAGDTDAALATVERCLEQDPEYAGCWFLLGAFRRDQGDLPAAREAWLRALEIEPENSEISRELAWVIMETDGDLDLARQFAARAVELDPEDAANWHAQAVLAAAAGDEILAVESFRRYLEMAADGECAECVAEAEAFLTEQAANLPVEAAQDIEGAGMFALMLNIQEPVLEDLRVRQALALAVDRNVLADRAREAGFLEVEPSSAWLHPALLRLDYVDSGLSFTPDMAQFLLAEAGYPEGEGFPTLILQTNPDPRNEPVLLGVQEMWREILGIEVEIEIIEGDYFARLAQETPPLYRLGYGAGPDENPMNLLRTFFAADGEGNFMDYNNPEFERLLAEAERTDDPQARRGLFVEADNLVTAGDTVVIPLFHHFFER